jgi:chemotaxis response regulator CheB
MPTKCLLACADEILLGSIVEDLLNQSDDLVCSEIISTSQDEVLAAIDRVTPDVLVLCHRTHNTVPIQFAPLFMQYPELLIITVSTDDNYMHIYGKQKVLLQSSSDLLSVLQNV